MAKYEDGICPVCGAEIDFDGAYDHDDEGATLRFECPACGANGTAGYDLVFEGYHDVKDANGAPVTLDA